MQTAFNWWKKKHGFQSTTWKWTYDFHILPIWSLCRNKKNLLQRTNAIPIISELQNRCSYDIWMYMQYACTRQYSMRVYSYKYKRCLDVVAFFQFSDTSILLMLLGKVIDVCLPHFFLSPVYSFITATKHINLCIMLCLLCFDTKAIFMVSHWFDEWKTFIFFDISAHELASYSVSMAFDHKFTHALFYASTYTWYTTIFFSFV